MRKFKAQKSLFTTIVKYAIIAEIGCFIGSYIVWKSLASQETRYKFSKKYPRILNFYYSIGETLGGESARGFDQHTWEKIPPNKR